MFAKDEASIRLFTDDINRLPLPGGGKMSGPPPSFGDMEGEFVSYILRKELVCSFPVLERQTNPLGNMQGGYITAAFDNTMGPLSYLAARKPCTTIDLNTHYMRPIKPGDRLFVQARIVLQSPNIMFMTSEAYNSKDKLIATATTNIFILKIPQDIKKR